MPVEHSVERVVLATAMAERLILNAARDGVAAMVDDANNIDRVCNAGQLTRVSTLRSGAPEDLASWYAPLLIEPMWSATR